VVSNNIANQNSDDVTVAFITTSSPEKVYITILTSPLHTNNFP